MKKAMISTWYGDFGGIGAMMDCLVGILQKNGYSITKVFTAPYRAYPNLSVPFWKMGWRRPKYQDTVESGIRHVAIGVVAPEFEIPYYLPQKIWHQLIQEHDIHLTISGNCLAAYPFIACGIPTLVWAATPYFEDKKDRVRQWPFIRRWIDRYLISPVGCILEKKILRQARVLSLSRYTARSFQDRIPNKKFAVLPFPIDEKIFHPRGRRNNGYEVGFAGRLDDPRKNLDLLIKACAISFKEFPDFKLKLLGGEPSAALVGELKKTGLWKHAEWFPYGKRESTAEFYRGLDLFVIPSHQEGLCIAGLEAMASGCVVVSTRCGGPEEYIREGENGFLSSFCSLDLAEKISSLLRNQRQLKAFSEEGLRIIKENYSLQTTERIFWEQASEVFPCA